MTLLLMPRVPPAATHLCYRAWAANTKQKKCRRKRHLPTPGGGACGTSGASGGGVTADATAVGSAGAVGTIGEADPGNAGAAGTGAAGAGCAGFLSIARNIASASLALRSFSATGSDDTGAAATADAVGTARATAVATGGAGGVGPRGANGGGVGIPGVTAVAVATGTAGAGGAGGGNDGAVGGTGNFGAPGGPGTGGEGGTLPEDPSGGLSAHGGAVEVLPDTVVDLVPREDMVLGVDVPNLFAAPSPNVGRPNLEVELADVMPRPVVGLVPDSGGTGGVPDPNPDLVPAAGARGGCGVDCAFGADW